MLTSARTVAAVADALRDHGLQRSVVDPVMVATSGAQLLAGDAVGTICEQLLPLSYIVTPNVPEAWLMLEVAGQPRIEIQCIDDMKRLAAAIHRLGPKYVLVKGGHIPFTPSRRAAQNEDEKSIVANAIYGDDVDEVIELPYQLSRNTHGTGCSLACRCFVESDKDLIDRLRSRHSMPAC